MTHVPPQFRTVNVLMEEWRQRAAELNVSDSSAAEAYRRCADDLERLDVRTTYNPADGADESGSGLHQLAWVAVVAGIIGGVFLATGRSDADDQLHA